MAENCGTQSPPPLLSEAPEPARNLGTPGIEFGATGKAAERSTAELPSPCQHPRSLQTKVLHPKSRGTLTVQWGSYSKWV